MAILYAESCNSASNMLRNKWLFFRHFQGGCSVFFVFLLFHFDREEMDGFRQNFDEIIYEYAGFVLEWNGKVSVICVTVFS